MQHTALKHTPLDTAGFAHPARNVSALGIEKGMSVADFGAGSGAYTFAMAEALENSGHLYAIDVQRDLLTRIHNESKRRGFSNVKIIWADLERTNASKIASAVLDLVLISNLLFQIQDKAAVIREARRILKPQGTLVVIDWAGSFGGMGPRTEDVVPTDQAFSLFQTFGFESMQKFPAGAHHWGIRGRVPLKA